MKRYYVMLCAAFLCVFQLSAETTAADEPEPAVTQETKNEQEMSKVETKSGFQLYPNAFGFSGHSAFEGGLTYQRWFDNGFGFGVTGGGNVHSRRSYGNYNIQVSCQKMLVWFDLLKGLGEAGLYANAVAAHVGSMDYATSDKPNKSSSSKRQLVFKYGLGLGMGMEFLLAKHASLTAEIMLYGMYPLEVSMGVGGGLKLRF